ncbi:GNAT family N-acetyltransferase [Microlunatus speluncae]|uniref:GNAT family N-acetyltransferase n=1 Tax=Microlunatus speluncae TaxID=2594267 RepID=UPI001266488D|nr:GNAT family N-acetyltransferase [Microlunatus speluncae]
MTTLTDPWPHPGTPGPAITLVQLPVPLLHELARGDGGPEAEGSDLLTPYLIGEECAWLWRFRSGQVETEPADAPWISRLAVVPGITGAVGIAGFHGRPDARGMVEIGYRIDPQHRRNGYARASLETLLAVARDQPDVAVVRATISPDNVASRTLVEQYGFVEVGEQWDEEDGREIIFEVPARP